MNVIIFEKYSVVATQELSLRTKVDADKFEKLLARDALEDLFGN